MAHRRRMDRARALGTALLLRRRVPLSVTVEVTNRCNIKCRYCDPLRPGVAEPTTGQLLRLIDEFAALGTQRVGFTGGEPTLREDLPELLAYARGRGLITTVSTNGRLVGEHPERLRDASVVMVSVDGPPEVHDAMRGRGTYERSVAAIRALRAQGARVFSSTVITSASAAQIDHVLGLARAHGFSCIFALLFSEHHRSVPPGEHIQLAASDEESRGAYRLLLERKRARAPIVNSEAFLRYMADARYLDHPIRCKAARWYCAVGADGSVATCGLHLGEPGLPNGFEQGFASAFGALRKAPCDRAYCNFGVEQSMTLSLHPGAVLNFVRYLGRL